MFGSRLGPQASPSPPRTDSTSALSVPRRVVLGKGMSTDDVFGRSTRRSPTKTSLDAFSVEDLEGVTYVDDDDEQTPSWGQRSSTASKGVVRRSPGARPPSQATSHLSAKPSVVDGSPLGSRGASGIADDASNGVAASPSLRSSLSPERRTVSFARASPVSNRPGGEALAHRDSGDLDKALAGRDAAIARAEAAEAVAAGLRDELRTAAAKHIDEKVRALP